MKNIIILKRLTSLILFATLLLFDLLAQKHDYNMILGDFQIENKGFNNGLLLDFNTNPVSQSTFNLNMSFVDCVMSDENGKLLFYTSGCFLANKNHQIMANGDSLNWDTKENYHWSRFCPQKYGAAYSDVNLSLPDPYNRDKYYLFSELIDKNSYHIKLLQSTIDVSKDVGNGSIVERNKVVAIDTFSTGQVPLVCRHGNGKDWWVMLPISSPQDTTKWDNTYSFFLLNREGLKLHHKQDIGTKWGSWPWNGQSNFSPDGSRFARYNPYNGLQLFDFDRCSGYFSNPKNIFLPHSPGNEPWKEDFVSDTSFFFGGLSFSPNSKILYVSTGPIIYQFNLEGSNIDSTRIIVGSFDTTVYKIYGNVGFFQHTLAPDGRIFVQTRSFDTKNQHIINKPDELGQKCEFNKTSLKLISPNIEYANHFPNYRLGPLKGSACDTLSVATKELAPTDYGLKLFPNPASDRIQIDITLPHYDQSTKTEVVVVHVSGEIVQSYTMPDFAYLATLDISKYPSGVYGVQLRQRNKVLAVEKLVVVR